MDREREERTAKRGAGQLPVSWEELAAEEQYQIEPVDHQNPEQTLVSLQSAIITLPSGNPRPGGWSRRAMVGIAKHVRAGRFDGRLHPEAFGASDVPHIVRDKIQD